MRLAAVAAGLLACAGLLAGCGDDGDPRADALRAATTGIPTPAGDDDWIEEAAPSSECTDEPGAPQLPPSHRLTALGTEDPASYLATVRGALPPDARQVATIGDEGLRWTTTSTDGDRITLRLFASGRSTTLDAVGPAGWCA